MESAIAKPDVGGGGGAPGVSASSVSMVTVRGEGHKERQLQQVTSSFLHPAALWDFKWEKIATFFLCRFILDR